MPKVQTQLLERLKEASSFSYKLTETDNIAIDIRVVLQGIVVEARTHLVNSTLKDSTLVPWGTLEFCSLNPLIPAITDRHYSLTRAIQEANCV